jgi:DNA-binding response OmpR family regulator
MATKTILVVEDSASVLEIARSVLEIAGYRVLMAGSAGQALEISRGFAETIDLLFVDLVLPDRSGYGLAQQLQAERPGIRVLFTSGYTADVAIGFGIDLTRAFLPKPYRAAQLLRWVRELLDEDAEE